MKTRTIVFILISVVVVAVITYSFGFNNVFMDEALLKSIQENSKFDDSLKDAIIGMERRGVIQTAFDPNDKSGQIRAIIQTTDNAKFLSETQADVDVNVPEYNIVAGSFTTEQLIALSESESAEIFYEDMKVTGALDTAVDYIKAEPRGKNFAVTNTFGSGVKVCVLDSGIDDTHPYLKELPADHKKQFTDDNPNDGLGHGTHVSGIIMSDYRRAESLDNLIDGVAPGVDLYVGKVLRDTNFGYFSWFIEGLEWCTSDAVNAKVVSLSLGGGSYKGSCDSQQGFVCSVFNEIVNDKDVAIVVAMGNEGQTGGRVPACCSGVVSVANAQRLGNDNVKILESSSRSSEVDISAIGTEVLSTVPGNGLERWTGTSMATPEISGSIALLKSIAPDASMKEIVNAIYASAKPITGFTKVDQGNGLINVYGACLKLLSQEQTCADVTYNKIKVGKTTLSSLSTSTSSPSWIRFPIFEESDNISVLTRANYYIYEKLVRKSSGLFVNSSSKSIGYILDPKYPTYLAANGDIYVYYRTNIRNKVWKENEYYGYYVFERLDNFTAVKIKAYEKTIIKNVKANKFEYLNPIYPATDLGPTQCDQYFDASYTTDKCLSRYITNWVTKV